MFSYRNGEGIKLTKGKAILWKEIAQGGCVRGYVGFEGWEVGVLD